MSRDLITTLAYARCKPVIGGLAYYALKLLGLELPRSVPVGEDLEIAHGGFELGDGIGHALELHRSAASCKTAAPFPEDPGRDG